MGYLEHIASLAADVDICTVSVTVAPLTDDGQILAQRDGSAWHLPSGALEVGEDFTACAHRIAGNAGLAIRDLRSLGTVGARVEDIGNGLRRYDLLTVLGACVTGTADSDLQPVATADHMLTMDPRCAMVLRGSPTPFFEAPMRSRPLQSEPYRRELRRLVGATTCLILPAVAAIILTASAAVVLVKSREHDVWMIPGGMIEFGEPPADAVVREAQEETGLEVAPQRLASCYSGTPFVVTYRSGDVVQIVSFPFVAQVRGGSLHAMDAGEIREVRAFAPGDLPRMHPHWRQVLSDALAGRIGTVA